MKHQALQVLISVVLTQADDDGHGARASSSALYPHTFFGESTGRGLTPLGSENEHSGFGNVGFGRSGKSLNIDALPVEHSSADFSRESEAFHQSSRTGKAESFDEGVTSGRNDFNRNTFFGEPSTNPEKISTFESGHSELEHENVGRAGKQVRVIQEASRRQVANVEVRDFDQFHEDVQGVIKHKQSQGLNKNIRHEVVIPAQQHEENVPKLSRIASQPQFAFRNSRNEVKTLQQIHEEIEELKRAQNQLTHQDGIIRQDKIVETQRFIPAEQHRGIPADQHRVIPAEHHRVAPAVERRVIPVEPQRVIPAEERRVIPVEHQRVIPVEEVKTQQRIIPAAPVPRGNIVQQNFQSSHTGSQFRQVQTQFVHHDIQKRPPVKVINTEDSHHLLRNEIPHVQRIKNTGNGFRAGKSETFGNAGQSSTVFGISPDTQQGIASSGLGLASSGNLRSGNFFSSGRIGKSNSFEANRNSNGGSFGHIPSLTSSAKLEPELPRQGKVESSIQQNTFFAGQSSGRLPATQFSEGSVQRNQKNSGNFFSSGRIGKANSLERTNAQVPPLVTHDSQTQLQSVRNDARTIQHDQLNTRQQLLRNVELTQNIRPFHPASLNQHGNVPFVTQVHGVQSSPQIQIQSLPNIRPEIRGAVVQTQNVPFENVQTFPQTVQNHDSSSKPINAGQFQRFENAENFPDHISTPESVQPIQTASHNVERFPQEVPAGTDNFRPIQNVQAIPERQQIQASILEGQSTQPLLRTPQSSGFSHNGATLHGLQGAQRFPQPTQLNSEPVAVADQPIVSSKVISHSSNIIHNEAFDRHRDSFFERQKFQQTNQVTN